MNRINTCKVLTPAPFKEITPAIRNKFCGMAKCPTEILKHIFSYLRYEDLKKVSLVCYEFNQISEIVPKAWLKKLCKATAVVLGTDMRNKAHPKYKDFYFMEKNESGKPLLDYLFFKKTKIIWHVNLKFGNKDKGKVKTNSFFYYGDPSPQKIKSSINPLCFTKMTKTNYDSLICLNPKTNGDIHISKFTTNEFGKNDDYFYFKKDINCTHTLNYPHMLISEITSKGLVAIGESLPDYLKITIRNCSRQIKTEVKIDDLKKIDLIGLALFPYKDDHRLAIVYTKEDSCFLYIYSCKEKNKLFQLNLNNRAVRKNLTIEEEKIVISDTFGHTEVVDMKTKKIIFSAPNHFLGLHQNKLILINLLKQHIDIHQLPSTANVEPISFMVDHLRTPRSDGLYNNNYAISDDLIAIICKQAIKLFNINTGAYINAILIDKIKNPGVPHSIFFEMKGSDSYLCVILNDSRVIYYSPKNFQKPV